MYVSLIVSFTQLVIARLRLQHGIWPESSLISWTLSPFTPFHISRVWSWWKPFICLYTFRGWLCINLALSGYLAWCEGPRQTAVISCRICQVLYGSKDMAISSLAWISEPGSQKFRLISGGLDGFLVDWDMAAGVPSARTDALGGAVWAISRRPLTDKENGTALWYLAFWYLASMTPCFYNTLLVSNLCVMIAR